PRHGRRRRTLSFGDASQAGDAGRRDARGRIGTRVRRVRAEDAARRSLPRDLRDARAVRASDAARAQGTGGARGERRCGFESRVAQSRDLTPLATRAEGAHVNTLVNTFLLVYAALFPIVNPFGSAP